MCIHTLFFILHFLKKYTRNFIGCNSRQISFETALYKDKLFSSHSQEYQVPSIFTNNCLQSILLSHSLLGFIDQ